MERAGAATPALAFDPSKQSFAREIAPVFAAIARKALLYLGVPPERERPELWPGEPVPVEEIRSEIERGLGRRVDEVFAWLDPIPAASAAVLRP